METVKETESENYNTAGRPTIPVEKACQPYNIFHLFTTSLIKKQILPPLHFPLSCDKLEPQKAICFYNPAVRQLFSRGQKNIGGFLKRDFYWTICVLY
ncbi:MAG: hypothetical protein IJN92_05520 [Lachnospiraceae bacterium]|nr:hypothetical protein [Lachnospiraceae bacterium]